MKYFIVSCAVILVLGLIERKMEKGGKKRQKEQKFVERAQNFVFTLGAIVIGMIAAIYAYFGITDPEQINNVVANVCLIVLGVILGIYPMLLTIPGFWEIRVDGDDICVVKCFVFKKRYKFSELIRCKQTRGG